MEDKEHGEDMVKREEKEENWMRNGSAREDGGGEEIEKQGEGIRELDTYQ